MKKGKIALIGFRATGKSLVGKILAMKTHWPLVDMDKELIASLGQDIDSYVRTYGWESFREAESKLLHALAERERLVVSTGGGVIERTVNREKLKEQFFVVWLRASPETIHARLLQDPETGANRPPLTHLPMENEIEEVLRRRAPLYEEIADLILDTDDASPEELVSRIILSAASS
ncbi:shikimate kinase [Desulforhabdus amnigena]|jgi:shikimate kinase|uniref:Shikimate kinase n=1 Tax=Desulforhabdus amnigena TaxID=40218 RepID=A0A9W6D1T6_9BACT|nr:shikimate kinase [Desulforhabdus amnigena]NLJ29719.1 shikimate kinase [Deltaproteobacteria bacterium]GLI32682.1 shikimate kinase [Desulforhabdus amnigena]